MVSRSAFHSLPAAWRGRLREHVRHALAAAEPEFLRERSIRELQGAALEPPLLAARSYDDAAVLLGLVPRAEGWMVLLTERARNLRRHAGQVGLPGGLRAGPGENATATALREANEEVGLRPNEVEVAGRLGAYLTVSGFRVVPVVGFVVADFVPHANPGEVAGVFEVPLVSLLAPTAFASTWRERAGVRFKTREMVYGGHCIWGATAAILMEFVKTINYETTE